MKNDYGNTLSLLNKTAAERQRYIITIKLVYTDFAGWNIWYVK